MGLNRFAMPSINIWPSGWDRRTVMAIRELPRFMVRGRDGIPEHTLLRFADDRFLPLFSTPDAARRFIAGSGREFLQSGPVEWRELYELINGLADIDLDAILVDHDGTGRKQTVESFPFANTVLVIKRWKAAGDPKAPIRGYSTPREIEAPGGRQSSEIFDADDESELEMPE